MDELLAECVSSSSSSLSSSSNQNLYDSSSDDDEFLNFQEDLFKREAKNRVQTFVKDVVKNYSEDEFRHNFRMSRRLAYNLVDKFANSKQDETRQYGGRKNVTAESQCLEFLWFAGNKQTYREVSNLVNITQPSVHRHLTYLLEFLFEISPQYIKFPSTEVEKVEKTAAFSQLAGFPNVIGCIDGYYIYIRERVNKIRSTYINRHGLISITLLGIYDADKKFWDVFIGSPSKIHDSRIYSLSYISEKMPELCGEYHILGNAAYPLREYLLTPYNKKHCQTRVKIENTFGLLKQRFRQLIRIDFFTVERMCKFVLGCCVIHNLCIENGDIWDEEENVYGIQNVEGEINTAANSSETQGLTLNEETENISDAALKHLGEMKRTNVADTF